MAVNKTSTQQNSTIRPVRDYLINGPIPPEDLYLLDFVESYLDMGIIDMILDVHFMLETVCSNGAPKWWKGSVVEFEEEFHDQYQGMINNINEDSEAVWMACDDEVRAKRLSPLLEGSTKEQVKIYLAQGRKLLQQTYAVELLLDMWVEAREMNKG